MFARPIHICHLGKFYPPAAGGIESHVQTLARGQAQQGAKVRVVCINHLNREGNDVTWTRYGATSTVEDSDGDVRVTRLGRSASIARFDILPGLPRLLMDLQYSPVDVVHLHTPNPTMLLTLAGLRLSKPIVVTHHSDVISQRWLVHVMRPLEKIVYGRAAALMSSSPAYAEASEVLSRHREKVEIVPLGQDLQPIAEPSPDAMREARILKEKFGDAPLWLSVGRCVYYKGLHTAISALRQTPGRLLIIGEGPLRKNLEKQALDMGVADRVVFFGRATEAQLVGAYHAATALWFPSNARSEAFGLVQIEAMAAGCPVINTEIAGSGASWVSRGEETGITIPIENPTALSTAARRILEEPGLRERFAAAGRSRATAEFTHDRMAARTLDVYARVLRESATGGRVQDAVLQPVPRLEHWVKNWSRPGGRAASKERRDSAEVGDVAHT